MLAPVLWLLLTSETRLIARSKQMKSDIRNCNPARRFCCCAETGLMRYGTDCARQRIQRMRQLALQGVYRPDFPFIIKQNGMFI